MQLYLHPSFMMVSHYYPHLTNEEMKIKAFHLSQFKQLKTCGAQSYTNTTLLCSVDFPNVLNFDIVQFINLWVFFFLLIVFLVSYLRIVCLTQGHKDLLFSPIIFIVLGLHLEYDPFLINFYTWCKAGSTFIFLNLDIQLFQHHVLKKVPSIKLPLHLCRKSIVRICVYLRTPYSVSILPSILSFLSILSCLSIHQYYLNYCLCISLEVMLVLQLCFPFLKVF